jgi:hypothetical protein
MQTHKTLQTHETELLLRSSVGAECHTASKVFLTTKYESMW